MRYVLINERFSFGGAEMQSLREKHLMENKGHDVLYITFDNSFPQGWDKDEPKHYNFTPNYSLNQRRLYSYVADRGLAKRALEIINSFDPAFIHVNNNIGYAYTIDLICMKYKTVRTIRDYSAVCTNGFCIDRQNKICGGVCKDSCLKKCMPKKKKRQFLSDYVKFKKRRCLDRKAANIILCPSRTLAEYCCHNGLKTYCINNPFDFSAIDSRVALDRSGSVRRFLYYGLVAKHKGVQQLIDAFKEFSADKDVTLEIAGRLDDSFRETFEQSAAGCSKIVYHGKLSYTDTMKLLSEVDCVAVPSLWMENYPNTVLESLGSGCIVIASNRGGMKEMIRDDRMIFDVLDKDDIISKLELAYNMEEKERLRIIKQNYEFVRRNNSLEIYYKRFMKLVSLILE